MAHAPQRQGHNRIKNGQTTSASAGLFAVVLGIVVVLCAAWALSRYRDLSAASTGETTTGQDVAKTPLNKTPLNKMPFKSTSPFAIAPPPSPPIPPSSTPTPPASR